MPWKLAPFPQPVPATGHLPTSENQSAGDSDPGPCRGRPDLPAGCPGRTRLWAGSAGGGGSVVGAANMAAAGCWCWACERSAKCEVERGAPGPCGDRDACFPSARLALLLLLRGWGPQCVLSAPPLPGPPPGVCARGPARRT